MNRKAWMKLIAAVSATVLAFFTGFSVNPDTIEDVGCEIIGCEEEVLTVE